MVRQRERFLVLMNEWNQVREAEVIATQSAGLAQERYGIYLESVQAKMNQFKAAWEEFWMKSINSNTVKVVLDLGKGLLNLANHLGGVKSILAFLPAILAKINLQGMIAKIKEAGGVLDTLKQGFSVAALNAKKLADAKEALARQGNNAAAAARQLTDAEKAASQAMVVTNWVSLALALAGVAYNLYNAWEEANSLETALKKASEAARDFENAKRDADEQHDRFIALEKAWKEYDKLKDKVTLTADEAVRLRDVQNEIKDLAPLTAGEYSNIGDFMISNKVTAEQTLAIEKQRLDNLREIEKIKAKDAIEEGEEAYKKLLEEKEYLDALHHAYIYYQELRAEDPENPYYKHFSDVALSEMAGLPLHKKIKDEAATFEIFERRIGEVTVSLNEQALTLLELTGDTEKYGWAIEKNDDAIQEWVDSHAKLVNQFRPLAREVESLENVVEKATPQLSTLIELLKNGLSGDNLTKFSAFADQILSWQKYFEDGKISIENYFNLLQDKINDVDLGGLFEDDSDSALQFLSTMAVAASEALMYLDNKFEEGNLSINDYMQGLIGASDAVRTQAELLLEHAEAAGLSAEEIANLKAEYDEFASSLTQAQEDLIATMPLAESITAGFADAMTGAMQVGSDNWNHWINQMVQDAWAFHDETGAIFRDSAGNILTTMDAMGAYAGSSMQAMQHFAQQAAGHISSAVNGTLAATEEGMRLVGNTIAEFEVELIPSLGPGVEMTLPVSSDLAKGITEFKFPIPSVKLSGTANISTYVPAAKNFGTEIFMPGGGGYTPPSAPGGGGGGGRGANDEARRQEEERKNAEKAYQDLLKMTVDMLKHRAKEAIRALKEEVNAYKELIDKKKDLIDQEKRERDLAKDKANREKAIADLQAELAEAMFDDSEAGIARRLELEEELYKKQEEMADFNYENSVDARKRALDQMYEDFKESKEKEIEALEEYLRREGEIVQEALELIEGRTQEFYDQLMEWNMTYGSGIAQDVIDSWKGAIEWIDVWKRGAIEAISAVAAAGGAGAGSMNAMAGSMRKLGDDALDAAAKVQAFFNSLGGGGYMLPIGRVVRTEYHDGGIVGGAATLQETEVFAKLLKGEVVVTQGQAANFMRNTLPNIANSNENTNNFTFNVPIQIHGEVGRNTMNTIKSSVFDGVSDALMKAGIKSNANTFGIG